jgi:pre-mRNA-splicing factor CDC5/CEF1
MAEARNLRNMVSAQTPLLGEENTPLHVGPGGGTGFEGATPRHQVAFTPNPLATPYRTSNVLDGSATPRTEVGVPFGATPLRTPMRDNLSINPGEDFVPTSETPRNLRLRESAAKRALKAGFMNLPKPENNFELMVPDDEDAETDERIVTEEDAAELDARIKRRMEEEERKALARRSQVVQRGLPRPPNVNVEKLLQDLSLYDDVDPKLVDARRLMDTEITQLMHHDSLAHPIPGTSYPGGTKSSYEVPLDKNIEAAKLAVQVELASSLGFPDATEEQTKQGLAALWKEEDIDEGVSWANIRQRLAYDVEQRRYVDPEKLTLEQRIAGYTALLDESRETMSKEAGKISKSEKKLNVTLGGYQARSNALVKRLTDGFDSLVKGQIEYESFSRLKINESVAGPGRVAALAEEVERLARREKMLQDRYAELESERRDAEERVAAAEERIMAEAEALNEQALASADGV